MIGGIVQGLSNLTTGIMNWDQSKKQHKENMQFQKDQFEWQKQQAEIQRQREDTAIQRRAEDLRQAGFNPYLAENDGAQSTAASGGGFAGDTTDQRLELGDMSGLDPVSIVNSVYNVLRGKNQYEGEKADTVIKQNEALRQLELNKQNELETEYKKLQNSTEQKRKEEIEANIKNINARYNELMNNLNISKNWGIRTTDSLNPDVVTGWAAANVAKNAIDKASQKKDDGNSLSQQKRDYYQHMWKKELQRKSMRDVISQNWDLIPGKTFKEKKDNFINIVYYGKWNY